MAAGTGTQKELRVQIVDFQPGDLPAVRALELECFSDAWSEKLLQDLLTTQYKAKIHKILFSSVDCVIQLGNCI